MKKFFYKMLIFSIPILLLWIFLEVFYRFVPNNYTEKKRQMIIVGNDVEVLILGNSHAFYGINPDFFDLKAYNLSNVSQSLYFDELLLNKYIGDLKKLKHVVLTVDYFTLSQLDNTSEDAMRKYYYHHYMDLEVPIISKFDAKQYSLALTRNLEMNIEFLKEFIDRKSLINCNERGWAEYVGVNSMYNNSLTGFDIAKKHEDGSNDFENNRKRIERIIKLCAKNDIDVMIVTMPVTTHYAENVNSSKLKKVSMTCKEVASEFKNVTYLNLFKDSRFDNFDFYDSDHLNSEGAFKCTEILNLEMYKTQSRKKKI